MANRETNAHQPAERYLALGGKRLSNIDDNIVSTRKWDDEPVEASRFWDEHIAALPEDRRIEVETHLPSMNDE
ncbi:hypothetical protein QTL95_17380 [Rhizobium sp. S152]|uniref:hypothetical protein n=1 Tax=Rhizobium sp. S152 TaxID=3055038 RepID=UPI0025A9852E|nr:hypothetical protein [Rhizobium sp. S152]MDM9627674.1 hypothetical protein [Rhizobium sp. S152]